MFEPICRFCNMLNHLVDDPTWHGNWWLKLGLASDLNGQAKQLARLANYW